ncbi:retrovirus-related pol polyprotein from transposon TNT 1-94 [Tanacetum coccineum]|uniref:Retrovirus-related pol polyprotein from transposon TNT 1-94 n=1 Tax=Tanacetum coccineum TaxID=301880 RepID=A0ABQ5FDY9_9ASTR
MEAAVKQCSVDRKCCEIQQKQFLIESDRLLDKIISQELLNIVLNSSVIICDFEKNNEDSVNTCAKCLELEAELLKKNDVYIELLKRFLNLEQHCISLEVAKQLNKEIFQKDKSSDNQNHPEIQEYFEQNDLKAQLQAKDIVISKLKETIHSLRENINSTKLKKDIDEIETINIELEHNLKTQIQEKVFANAALINGLRKLKGKNLNLEPLASKVLKSKDAHLEYIKHSREHADILCEIVKSARALSLLDSNLDSAFAVTPKNKDKKVRFADLVTSSSKTQKQVDSHKPKDSNQPLLHSTGVISSTGTSGSKPTGNTKNNRISQSSSSNKTNKLKDKSRSVKSRKNKKNRVAKTECNAYLMQSMLNANSKYVCAICNECLFDANHDKCVLDYVHDVNVLSKSKPAKRKNKKQIWKPTGKVYTKIGYKWKPTGRTFTIVRNKCPSTSRRPKATKFVGCPNCSVFGNDQIAKIMGYGDYQIGNVTISRVYYKDEAPEFIIKFLKMIQVYLNSTVKNIRTDNGTEFVNQTLPRYYEDVDISHETSVARQSSFHSLLHLELFPNTSSSQKTPYKLLHDRKPDLSYLYVFGALCYLTNDSEDLGKLEAKADF